MIYVLIAWFFTGTGWGQNPVVVRFETKTACEAVLKEMRSGARYNEGKCLEVQDSKVGAKK